jgi:hypothetical protein
MARSPKRTSAFFLQELKDIRDLRHGPWAVVGDFNLIVDATDKNNTNLNRRMMDKFRRLLCKLDLKRALSQWASLHVV